MSELKLPRLLAAAKEFNVGADTLIDFLARKGFNKDDLKPTAKLTEAMYFALQTEFQNDSNLKRKANLIEIPNNQHNSRIRRDEDEITFRREDRKFTHIQYYKKQLAGDNIEKCLKDKSTNLDLGNCGLVDEDFEEGGQLDKILRDCIHVENLVLSNEYWMPDTSVLFKSKNNGKSNRLYKLPNFIKYLTNLKLLVCAGDIKRNWGIKDLSTLSHLEELVYLDLSFNAISQIEFISSLHLHTLIIRGNRIVTTENLDTFFELEELILGNNQITTINEINSITSLQKLDLGYNNLENANIQLPQLTMLNLSGNNISGTLFLRQCENLHWLDISKNKLSNNNLLYLPTKLRTLNLSANEFSNLEMINNLSSLIELDLSDNVIIDLKGIGRCSNLQRLSLKGNEISNTENIAELINLNSLDLSFNKITLLDGLKDLNRLTNLVLTTNQISDVNPILNIQNLRDVDLFDNPILDDMPDEEIKVGWKAIKAYILDGDKKVLLKEVKLLLLGNPNVGKSNFLEFLETGKVPIIIDPKGTHGIKYKIIDNLIKGTRVHCWDFGGQEYFHATHQLFFSPGALHIILWSKEDIERENVAKETCFELSYWLRCVEHLIKNKTKNKIEVIVAENKIDLNNNKVATLVNQSEYESKFQNLNFHFTSLGLNPLKRTDGFKELIVERIETLYYERPNSYKHTLKQIQSKSIDKNYLDVNGIYKNPKKGLKEELEVLHFMGLLLYYPNILPNKIFTSPQILLDIIYENVLKDPKIDSLNKVDISKAIEGNLLDLDINDIVSLLKYFNLVFQIPYLPDEYFIPQYLREPPTLISFFEQHHFQKANIKIAADNFLMNLAMLKVFSEYGQYVIGQEKKEFLFWKEGIIIEKDGVILLIKFNRKEQTIELYPDVKNENFELQRELVSYILNCASQEDSKEEKPLEWDEYYGLKWTNNCFSVWVSLDGIFFTVWNDLYEKRKNGIYQIESYGCTQDGKNQIKTLSVFDYNKFLPKNQQGAMKKVFISYSKVDSNHLQKLENHLSVLKRNGKIGTWNCRKLLPGEKWDGRIKKELEEADLILFLVSDDFLATDYIWDIEIKKAIDRDNDPNDDVLVVPIILRACDWEESPLGVFNSPIKANVITTSNDIDQAWTDVVKQLRRVL